MTVRKRDLRLPDGLRDELKKPLGILVRGTPQETMENLRKFLEEKRFKILISVGDFVSKNVLEAGLPLKVAVIDNKVMRREIVPWFPSEWKSLRVENPPATIKAKAWVALEEAISLNRGAVVIVEGEEDLLTLPVIVLAPTGSVVVYGQPKEGIVIVEVTEERKQWSLDLLERMEEE
jgi:uncharacterized protein (UPF0218 family)